MHGVTDRRRGRYLALVNSRVLALRISYPEGPLFRVGKVLGFEALIARVGVTAYRQQVYVAVSHPGNRSIPQVLHLADQMHGFAHEAGEVRLHGGVEMGPRTGRWPFLQEVGTKVS